MGATGKLFRYTTDVIIYEDEVWAYLENIEKANVALLKAKKHELTEEEWSKAAEFAMESGDFISCELTSVDNIP